MDLSSSAAVAHDLGPVSCLGDMPGVVWGLLLLVPHHPFRTYMVQFQIHTVSHLPSDPICGAHNDAWPSLSAVALREWSYLIFP